MGFMTRLTTISAYTLWVRNNHSVVMSDFYKENSDMHVILGGDTGEPEGSVTIQGGKTHLRTRKNLVDIDNYSGRVMLGPDQYYVAPLPAVIVQRGNRPVDLILIGNHFYRTMPEFRLSGEGRLTLIGNQGCENTKQISDKALANVVAGLDDLRRLGEIDYGLNHSFDKGT